MKTIAIVRNLPAPVNIVPYVADVKSGPTESDRAQLARITHAVYHATGYDLLFRGTYKECLSFCAGARPPKRTPHLQLAVVALIGVATGAYLQNLAWAYDFFGTLIIWIPGIPIAVAAALCWLRAREVS